MAVRALEDARRRNIPSFLVRFEDLREDPVTLARQLAAVLDSRVLEDRLPRGANTSFRGGGRKVITQTEAWLCERLAGTEMSSLDYELTNPRPRLSDIPDALAVTARFALYQLWRVATDPGARVSVADYLRRALKRSG